MHADQLTLNVAAYAYLQPEVPRLPNDELERLRAKLREQCTALALKGTVLLAPEGINMFVAGPQVAVESLLDDVKAYPSFAEIDVKRSVSDSQPFSRMVVKLKRHIIPNLTDEESSATAPYLEPRELQKWLDEGREVVLLDTRNDYEVAIGTFNNAVDPQIGTFRDFAAVANSFPDDWREKPVVTFCTGGIRCEKAAPFLKERGYSQVYQLAGGILRYFEECGAAHYNGDCFVFDKRVALDVQLEPTRHLLCYACLAPLTPFDAASSSYVEGVQCPHCVESRAAAAAERGMQARQDAIAKAVDPLPGKRPYTNYRPMRVRQRQDGMPLIEFLQDLGRSVPRQVWGEAISAGRIVVPGVVPSEICETMPVAAGQRVVHIIENVSEPDVAADIRVLCEDDDFFAVDKPAPLPVHPCGRFNRNTLSYILARAFGDFFPRPVHRLDANTTGVQIFAKRADVAAAVLTAFEAGQVEKTYLAQVHGDATGLTRLSQPIGASATTDGRGVDAEGRCAETEVVVVGAHDGTTFLRLRPSTGRTNQLRAQLADAGFPIVGDAPFIAKHRDGQPNGSSAGSPATGLRGEREPFVFRGQLRLHAADFSILYQGRRRHFFVPPPKWWLLPADRSVTS